METSIFPSRGVRGGIVSNIREEGEEADVSSLTLLLVGRFILGECGTIYII